jgi:hypothetical protein
MITFKEHRQDACGTGIGKVPVAPEWEKKAL